MKIISLFFSAVFLFAYAPAQKIHVNTFIGMANYTGDLQEKRFTFNHAKIAFGAGLSYELSNKIMLRSDFKIAKVAADDKTTSNFPPRNLNFTSKIYDGQLVGEYYFRDLDESFISPYVFAGVGIYHFNPYTNDSAGNKVFFTTLKHRGPGILPE